MGTSSIAERQRESTSRSPARKQNQRTEREEFERALSDSGFRATVLLRDKAALGWKHHYRCGLPREDVGIVQARLKLSKDPERFAWMSAAWLSKRTKRWRGRKDYSKYWRSHALGYLRRTILVPARRFRSGAWRNGVILVDHDSVCRHEDGYCIIDLDALFAARKAVENCIFTATATATPTATFLESTATATATRTATPTATRGSEKRSQAHDTAEDNCNRADSSLCNPVKPIEPILNPDDLRSPHLTTTGSHRSPLSKDEQTDCIDCDESTDQTKPEAKRFSVAEFFAAACPDATGEKLLSAISAGEFQTSFLRGYEHTELLVRCCQNALQEFGYREFLGSRTCGELMDCAMTALRGQHGRNVPAGWFKVLKGLKRSENNSFVTFHLDRLCTGKTFAAPLVAQEGPGRAPYGISDELWNELLQARSDAGRPLEGEELSRFVGNMAKVKSEGRNLEDSLRRHIENLKAMIGR